MLGLCLLFKSISPRSLNLSIRIPGEKPPLRILFQACRRLLKVSSPESHLTEFGRLDEHVESGNFFNRSDLDNDVTGYPLDTSAQIIARTDEATR